MALYLKKFAVASTALVAVLLAGCASVPMGDTRGMNRAAFGAYKSAESGVALARALGALQVCNEGQSQTNSESETEIQSGSSYRYDSRRAEQNNYRRSNGSNRTRSPVQERYYSNVDSSTTVNCGQPSE